MFTSVDGLDLRFVIDLATTLHVGLTRLSRWLGQQWLRLRGTIVPLWESKGQNLLEYVLILALIVLIVVGVVGQVGNRVNITFEKVSCEISGGEYHDDEGNHYSDRCKQ